MDKPKSPSMPVNAASVGAKIVFVLAGSGRASSRFAATRDRSVSPASLAAWSKVWHSLEVGAASGEGTSHMVAFWTMAGSGGGDGTGEEGEEGVVDHGSVSGSATFSTSATLPDDEGTKTRFVKYIHELHASTGRYVSAT
mmetsp:Transcript_3816/g.10910  ORF Transcript_3816/g.10910 Transcript_3816/m.10910 type:complete len:140 (-) Transcript_3816:2206-2625(-)